MHKAESVYLTMNPSTIEDLAEIFSFNETRKRTLQTRFYSVLCDTVSDKDTMFNCGGIILR
jgi:hypothetical protein